MDKEIAQNLFNELSKHGKIINPNKDIFLNMLEEIEIPESSRFYEELPFKEQVLNELGQERYAILSLRKILRNPNAKRFELKGWKKLLAESYSILGIYSSTQLLRRLRENKGLIELMNKSAEEGNPFSLLGRFEDCDYNNFAGILYRSIKPILIIPNSSNTKEVIDWENSNTVYQKEFLMFTKKINEKEYLTQGLKTI